MSMMKMSRGMLREVYSETMKGRSEEEIQYQRDHIVPRVRVRLSLRARVRVRLRGRVRVKGWLGLGLGIEDDLP